MSKCKFNGTKINILGVEYTIYTRSVEQDPLLNNADAYCDRTSKEIVLLKLKRKNTTLHNPDWLYRKLLRHEIIHAFLFESGLGECTEWRINQGGHNEQIVDWFAVQYPKIHKLFVELGIEV